MSELRNRPRLVVVSGWPAAGKSTLADALAVELGATVVSFDWLMSALRIQPELWSMVEEPVERQRRVGWDLLSRVAEQQLRAGRSCIIDLVARPEIIAEWSATAVRLGADFAVVECSCSDADVHRARVEGRVRAIPGWYELTWETVQRSRELYVPLPEPKIVVDGVDPLRDNLARVLAHLLDA